MAIVVSSQDMMLTEIADERGFQSLHSLRNIQVYLETQCKDHIIFMLNALFLILSWTSESFHQTFLRADDLPIPSFPSDDEYWNGLSTTVMFEDKTSEQLAQQMYKLIAKLFWLSAGGSMPHCFEPAPDFTPLQNICLYMQAFGINENPLEAFQPFDSAKLVRSLRRFWPQTDQANIYLEIQTWDTYLQSSLPINCPRSNEIRTPAFTAILTCMNVDDQEAVQFGIEHLREKFPSFRKPIHQDLVQLHQCYHSSANDEVLTMLQNWVSTREGARVKFRLFEVFQTSLAPEELALALTNMMILWNLDPPDEEDVSSPLPPNILGLSNLLSMPSTLKQSFDLLLELFRSFRDAVKCSVKEDNVPIMQLLERAICGDEYTSVSEELWEYCMQRLKGKCQREVAIDADFEQLAGGLSLLENP